MSVIVKGMDMPKNCKDCPFSDHEAWCLIPGDWRERYYCPDNERSEYCPLVEIPTPHGRLIDADKLKSRLVLDNDSNELQRISADILKWIDIQETVVEGSET